MNKYFFSNYIFLLFVLTIFANKVLSSSDLLQDSTEANIISNKQGTFEYEWQDNKGIIQSARTTVSPFSFAISPRDKSSLDEIIKNLDEIKEFNDDNLRIMCHLFSRVDGSNCAPISFDLHLRYKQIPWHLLSLNYWQFSHNSNLSEEVLKEFLATSNLNGKTSMQQMFKKISQSAEKLDENDLKGIKILQPFWEYRYVDNVLTDLSRRIESILSCSGSEVLSEQTKIAILRFLQVTGEYCSKLKHITFFSQLNAGLDCEEFRNRLCHLENPECIMNELFKADNIPWSTIIKDLQCLKPLLDTYQTKWQSTNKIEDNFYKWQSIKAKKIKGYLRNKIDDDFFPGIANLRVIFSQILKQEIEKSNLLSSSDIKDISFLLTLYSSEQQSAIEEKNTYESNKDSINNQRKNLEDEIIKLIGFKPPLDKESDKILDSTNKNISTTQKKEFLEIVEEPNSNERNKKVKNFIGKLYPLKKLVVTEKIKDSEKVQKKIKQSLSIQIDIQPERRLYEYEKFVRQQMHKNCQIKLDNESFWSITPSYFEIIFAKMRNKPVDTIDTKKEYRLSLIKQSLNTLDWIREKMNLSDITLTDELLRSGNYTPLAAEQLPTLIINNQLHFNNFRASISIDRLNHHIQELPVFLYTIEFYIGLAYESLRPIFHFPEFANHYLKNLAIRNYYDHPDPTHLMPLTIWNNEGESDSSNGRIIYERPDRNDAYVTVLVNEIARICVPLYHVIYAIHDRLKQEILHSQSKVDDSKKNSIVNSCFTKNLVESRAEFLSKVSARYIEAIRNAYSDKGEVLWGGDIELIEIAKLHNLRITVYHTRTGETAANLAIGSPDGYPINLLLNGLHYNYCDSKSEEWKDVPGDNNCLFHAVLRAIAGSSTLEEVSSLRNAVADRYLNLINSIDRREQVTRSGTPENQNQPIIVTLTHQNDNPIYSRFAAIFEAEGDNQLQNAIADLPFSTLRNQAVQLKNIQ